MRTREETIRSPFGVTKKMNSLYELADVIAMALLAGAVCFVFALRFAGVEGESMLPTLRNGQRIVLTAYSPNYDHGDIVVVSDMGTRLGRVIVKRIIGIPGDVIDIDFDAHIVYRNGEALNEGYIAEPTARREDFEGPVTVGRGKVFVMGDNRNNSADSRSEAIGQVDQRSILGRVLFQ